MSNNISIDQLRKIDSLFFKLPKKFRKISFSSQDELFQTIAKKIGVPLADVEKYMTIDYFCEITSGDSDFSIEEYLNAIKELSKNYEIPEDELSQWIYEKIQFYDELYR